MSSQFALAEIVIHFDPSVSVVGVGEIFEVDILADAPAPDALFGWGMDMDFIGSILGHLPAPTSVEIDPAFDAAPTLDGDFLAGLLPFAPPPAPPALPVSGVDVSLATLTLEAVAPGMTSLNGGYDTADFTEGFVIAGGNFAEVSFQDASVTVIPAPAGAILGLIGLSLTARRNRKEAA